MAKLAVSEAKSVSRIRERAADTFSTIFPKLDTVLDKRFCTAPKDALLESIFRIAESITSIAFCEPIEVLMSIESTVVKELTCAFAASMVVLLAVEVKLLALFSLITPMARVESVPPLVMVVESTAVPVPS